MKLLRFWLFSCALTLAACAGGGSGTAPPLSAPKQPAQASVRISLTIPAKSGASRRPAYVSPATQSVSVQVDTGSPAVQNLSPGSANCSSAGSAYPLNCTITVTASAGAHTVTLRTYDQSNAAGNQLSANSISVTFVTGQTPSVPITLAGVPVSILLSAGSANISASSNGVEFLPGSARTLLVDALDADGNYIVGPGSPAIGLSVTGSSSPITIASANSGNPNAFTVSASGFASGVLLMTATPASTLAGSALSDSTGIRAASSSSTFAHVGGSGIAFDPALGSSGTLFVTDPNACLVRLIDVASASASSIGSSCGFADSPAAVQFNAPQGIAYDSANGDLYLTDSGNCVIRQITGTGTVSTIAGVPGACGDVSGPGTIAQFNHPAGIAYDPASAALYVTDTKNCQIRWITLGSTVTVSTIAGALPSQTPVCGFTDGTGTAAKFNLPQGLTYDPGNGGSLYVTDTQNCAIRQLTNIASAIALGLRHGMAPIGGGGATVSTVSGGNGCGFSDGAASGAQFNLPSGIAYAPDGNVYITDSANCSIRELTTGSSATVSTIAGTHVTCAYGDGFTTYFDQPAFLDFDPATSSFYITDVLNHVIRQLQL